MLFREQYVCMLQCKRYVFFVFFQIHTVTPMCPAIDLEMTGLLTHTICSANEERQRETVNEIFSHSLSLPSIQHFKMTQTTERKGTKGQQTDGVCDAAVLMERLQVHQLGHL